MLHRLSISNYVLVESLELTFDKGLSVITGETGAGKSVMIGALGLILGQRADLKAIKEGTERCVLEAEFIDIERLKSFFEINDLEYDPCSCVIRRELSANGKSRAFVNDSPVSLNLLKELGQILVDIHSQHENLWLGKDSFQLNVLDMIAGNQAELQAYQALFKAYEDSRKEAATLEENLQKQRQEQDYLQFQYSQLAEAHLKEGEQEALESQREWLTHAEDIKTGLDSIEQGLSADTTGICAQLKNAVNTASQLQKLFPDMEEAHQRLESCLIELKDLQRDMERWSQQTEVNPQALMQVEDRLNLLYDLQRKHHCDSVEALLELATSLADKLQYIDQGDEALAVAKKKVEEYHQKVLSAASKLSKKRRAVIKNMETYMCTQLQQLGMPHARFQVQIEEKQADQNGADRVTFLFSANKNVAVQSITQIASGGEISRLMLCIKAMMAEVSSCACLLFDEIDTGVSGEIAHKMAKLMQAIAMHRQVLCITHLPQIAAKGEHHYKVYKSEEGEQAISNARLLLPEERLQELAKMLSGDSVSQAALDNAKLLLESC